MPRDTRERMVAGTAQLLATGGPSAASLRDVVALTESPRGSIYHHFPGGKGDLYDAALDLVNTRALDELAAVEGRPAAEVADVFFRMWRRLLTHTDYRAGCAVLAMVVAGDEPQSVEHAQSILARWRSLLQRMYEAGGVPAPRSRALAALSISAAEGAVVLARAERDLTDFDLIAEQVRGLLAN